MIKAFASIIFAIIAQLAVILITPTDANMGVTQKIFYIHLPFAWWSLISFFACAIFGGLFLKQKDARYDRISHASAEIGVIMSFLSLMTGSIWARHAWGVWWAWDPKLTTTLILFFLYASVLLIRNMDFPSSTKSKIASVFGILAFLDVPLVFFASRMWNSVHPVVFASREGGIDNEMLIGAVVSVIAIGLPWYFLLMIRTKILALHEVAKDRMDQILSNEDPIAPIILARRQRELTKGGE